MYCNYVFSIFEDLLKNAAYAAAAYISTIFFGSGDPALREFLKPSLI